MQCNARQCYVHKAMQSNTRQCKAPQGTARRVMAINVFAMYWSPLVTSVATLITCKYVNCNVRKCRGKCNNGCIELKVELVEGGRGGGANSWAPDDPPRIRGTRRRRRNQSVFFQRSHLLRFLLCLVSSYKEIRGHTWTVIWSRLNTREQKRQI